MISRASRSWAIPFVRSVAYGNRQYYRSNGAIQVRNPPALCTHAIARHSLLALAERIPGPRPQALPGAPTRGAARCTRKLLPAHLQPGSGPGATLSSAPAPPFRRGDHALLAHLGAAGSTAPLFLRAVPGTETLTELAGDAASSPTCSRRCSTDSAISRRGPAARYPNGAGAATFDTGRLPVGRALSHPFRAGSSPYTFTPATYLSATGPGRFALLDFDSPPGSAPWDSPLSQRPALVPLQD